NFGGNVNGLVSFLPKIKASTGRRHVVNIASMAAFLPGPQAGIYTASKFAVRGLTESLRYNLAPYGIGCSLCCPALTRTNAWTSALKRPDGFGDSGFPEVAKEQLEQFGTAFEEGMDPYEVGAKILRGMTNQDGLILTHPEHGPDFEEIHEKLMAALPEEEAPAGRLKIEELRRKAMRDAEAGLVIQLDDLTCPGASPANAGIVAKPRYRAAPDGTDGGRKCVMKSTLPVLQSVAWAGDSSRRWVPVSASVPRWRPAPPRPSLPPDR